jgi:hypothetical protein
VVGCTINNDDDPMDPPDPPGPDGSQQGTPDGSQQGTPDAPPGPGGGPVSGLWGYDETGPVMNDGCGSAPIAGEGPGDFTLTNHGDNTFTIAPGDGTPPFDCNLSGSAWECPDRFYDMEAVGAAVVSATARVNGGFSDAENGTGTQRVTVSCAGADCPAVSAATGATFPCHLSVDFRIEHLGL